jgi:oxygen-independent coproporphyrinogen-3 oxidase
MSPDVVKRYSAPVPRYTSYPTAPHFSEEVGAAQYAKWLAALPEGARLSLYVHIPFCGALCWYCGCSTKAVNRYEPVAHYLATLRAEIEGVAARVQANHAAIHMHWGGGSLNDPRGLDRDRIAAFAQAGITRASIGSERRARSG